jgi:hypothetical protein
VEPLVQRRSVGCHAPENSVEGVDNSADSPNESKPTQITRSLAPLEVTGITTVTIGTALWTVALIICLVFRTRLENAGHGDWPAICAAGVLLGLMGLRYTKRRARRLGN